MIGAVAFDVMDTLLRDPFREALTAASGRSLEELFERRDPSAYPALERGEIDESTYWSSYARVGIEVDPDRFHRVRRAGTRWLPGMIELLDELSGQVIRATASNYPVWIEEVAETHLQGRFEHVIASCHLGVRKPDRRFFEELLDRLGLPAHQVLFIDDRPQNVVAAQDFGLSAHRFVDAAGARSWLIQQGLALIAPQGPAGSLRSRPTTT